MLAPRILLCYQVAPDAVDEQRQIQQLIADIQIAGADINDINLRRQDIHNEAFLPFFQDELAACQWMLVIQTPETVASSQVRTAVEYAITMQNRGELRGIIRAQLTPVANNALPVIWLSLPGVLLNIDYKTGRDQLLLMLGIGHPDSWADTAPSQAVALLSTAQIATPVAPRLFLPEADRGATIYPPRPMETPNTPTMTPLPPPLHPQKSLSSAHIAIAIIALGIIIFSFSIAFIFTNAQTNNIATATATALAQVRATQTHQQQLAAQTATAHAQLSATAATQTRATAAAIAQANTAATASAIGATATAQAYQPTSYEAEAATNTLANGAQIMPCGGCSGGQKVGDVGYKGTLQFNNISAPFSGNYTLTIYYCSGEQRNASVSVNGGTAVVLTFQPTGSFTTVGSQVITVHLNAGTNTILIFNVDHWAPDFDRITV